MSQETFSDQQGEFQSAESKQLTSELGAIAAGNLEQDRPPIPEGVPPMPEGWTYLEHGSSKVEWRDVDLESQEEITISGRGLSAVTREEIEREQGMGFMHKTSDSYARFRPVPKGMSQEEFQALSIPLEMRVVFYPELAATRFVSDRWQHLPAETRELAAKYYYKNHQHGRHALVPRGETLQLLSKDTAEDGHRIYYYVPASVRGDYDSALQSEKAQ